MTGQWKEGLFLAAVSLSLVVIGFITGRWTAPACLPVATIVEEKKETAKATWQEKTETAAAVSATAETKKATRSRSAMRWYRPDGTLLKERLALKETGSDTRTSSAETSTHSAQAQGQSESRSESRTVVDLRPPARFHVQALVGIDLGAGLARRYGGSVSVRVVGPVSLVAVAFPGAKLYGAGVGISF